LSTLIGARTVSEILMPRLQLKGVNLMPARESFDPIETASRDEITALQLTRVRSNARSARPSV
jgi:hypothetical protein